MVYKKINLHKSILQTICYFDIFNIPLSFEKIKLFLYKYKIKKDAKIKSTLDNLIKKQILSKFDNYYFLKNRDRIVKLRYLRKNFCLFRWKKAQKAARWLEIIPFIRFVGVTNSLSLDNSNQNSDIDFFIITKKNRLWITRIITVLLLDILRLNKNKKIISNRICLGFFIDESYLNLIKLLDSNDDFYFTYWIANINPILDKKIYYQFIKKNDQILKNLPNYDIKSAKYVLRHHQLKRNSFLDNTAKFFEFLLNKKIGDFLEKKLYIFQKRRIERLEKNKIKFTIIDKNIMKLNAYNKSKKYNKIFKNNYKHLF